MTKSNDGGQAFPYGNHEQGGQHGMTLRDWFAAMAPNPSAETLNFMRQSDRGRNPYNDYHKPPLRSDVQLIAACRYEFADAMLAERAKAHE